MALISRLRDFSWVIQSPPDACQHADIFLVCSFHQGYKQSKSTRAARARFLKATSILKTKYWTWNVGEIRKHIISLSCHAKFIFFFANDTFWIKAESSFSGRKCLCMYGFLSWLNNLSCLLFSIWKQNGNIWRMLEGYGPHILNIERFVKTFPLRLKGMWSRVTWLSERTPV